MKYYPLLKSAKPLDAYCLMLTFANNEHRVYDFTPNLDHKFYSQLKNKILFENVSVVGGEIQWTTGQDFCPHTLYDESVPINLN